MKQHTLAMFLSVASSLFVAGCGMTSTTATSPSGVQRPGGLTPPTVPPDQGSCTAAKAEWAIGSAASEALLEQARVAANAAVARFLIRGQPITAEYLGTRLNAELDERQIVVSVRCG